MNLPDFSSNPYLFLTIKEEFYDQFLKVLNNRSKRINIDIYELLEDVGQKVLLINMMDDAIDLDSLKEAHSPTQLQLLFLKITVLVKFFYPIMDELDTMISKNVSIYKRDWEEEE